MTNASSVFIAWFKLCAANDEFVANYNRLRGTRITFAPPPRTPFEKLIDDATGHVPMPKNDPRELAAFVIFCLDMFNRIPAAEPASA